MNFARSIPLDRATPRCCDQWIATTGSRLIFPRPSPQFVISGYEITFITSLPLVIVILNCDIIIIITVISPLINCPISSCSSYITIQFHLEKWKEATSKEQDDEFKNKQNEEKWKRRKISKWQMWIWFILKFIWNNDNSINGKELLENIKRHLTLLTNLFKIFCSRIGRFHPFPKFSK